MALKIGETFHKFLEGDMFKAGTREASTILSAAKEDGGERPEKTARGSPSKVPAKGSGRGSAPSPAPLSENGSTAPDGGDLMTQIAALLDTKFALSQVQFDEIRNDMGTFRPPS